MVAGGLADPFDLIRTLDASPEFRRDSRLGGILHRGKVSFREACETDSLHVLIEGSKISVHVDSVSPLKCAPDGSARYSGLRVVAHNASTCARQLGRRLLGLRGRHRCNLDCELVWVDEQQPLAAIPASRPAYSASGRKDGDSMDPMNSRTRALNSSGASALDM